MSSSTPYQEINECSMESFKNRTVQMRFMIRNNQWRKLKKLVQSIIETRQVSDKVFKQSFLLACILGKKKGVEILVKFGYVNPTFKNYIGLKKAIDGGNVDTVKFLLQFPTINNQDLINECFIHSIKRGYMRIIDQFILLKKIKIERAVITALLYAGKFGKTNVIDTLFKRNVKWSVPQVEQAKAYALLEKRLETYNRLYEIEQILRKRKEEQDKLVVENQRKAYRIRKMLQVSGLA